MKRPQYVFRPNLNEPQHRRAWALLQQMPPAKRKEFLVQSILAAEQTNRLEKSIRKVVREELQAVNITGAVPSPLSENTGSYTANYEDFSDTEYLFGGTSIKREAGKDLSIDCALEVTDGTAKVFWISGADEEVTLLETTGTYSDTITLPEGGNYIGIECENFTGSIELNME